MYFPSTVLQLKWRWIDKSRFRILSLGCFGPRAVVREDLHGVDAAGDEAAAEPAPDQLEIHTENVLHITMQSANHISYNRKSFVRFGTFYFHY